MRNGISKWFTNLLLIIHLSTAQCAIASVASKSTAQSTISDPNIILFYISNSWKNLQRSMTDCNTLIDPKTHTSSILYLPVGLPIPDSVQQLKQHCALVIKRLPKKIRKLGEVNGDKISPAGLLYLPHPYVVPGGMFNEMYGWDSYFIIRGLIESHNVDLAHSIVKNFFFEIDHYGGILNGNRTYYLTRTQLPFLAPIIRAVYEADIANKRENLKWLATAYQYAVKDYLLWTSPPHLAGNTNLSRYYDFGSGPVSELAQSQSYYSDVVKYFLENPEIGKPYLLHGKQSAGLSHPLYTVSLCKDNEQTAKQNCKVFRNIGLSDKFYQGDRAMRESGFDTSFRFGPFSADTLDYAPVDLNSLLYKTEKDLEWMCRQLGKIKKADQWADRAIKRKEKINKYLWDETLGLYLDYNFRTQEQSKYPYATTFYPLWAGLCSEQQAKKLYANLQHFEKPGGIVTSLRQTGVQWDYPYGWAPIQLITIEGLYQYNYVEDANRISNKFLTMVIKNYMHDRTIREKYNVVSGTSQTNIKIGYKTNVIGFGWTNGVFLVLLHKLPSQLAKNSLGLFKHSEGGTAAIPPAEADVGPLPVFDASYSHPLP